MRKNDFMQKKWFRLDTAALIFPAIARRNWCNVFRLSAGLTEPVDSAILQEAVNELKPRFPSFFVTLKQGFFWCYLEESRKEVQVREDYAYPLTFMSRREFKENCLRVLYYKNRVAVEFFHALSDGRGGSVFLVNLLARYLELKYGIDIPKTGVIRDLSEPIRMTEIEDSFLKHAAPAASGRKERIAFRLKGTRETDGFKHLITGIVDTETLLNAAHRYRVSVTAFLAGVMAESIIGIQDEKKRQKKQKPVKITIPVDLRRLYDSETLRNFSLVINVGVEPRYGRYTLEEICRSISHQIGFMATPQQMAGMVAANVQPQRLLPLRLAPLEIKHLVMDLVYRQSGEKSGCLNISNLSRIEVPEAMQPYLTRAEFIIGPQRSYPNNCSVASFGGKTYINMIRNIREKELERRFFSKLVELGIPVEIESND